MPSRPNILVSSSKDTFVKFWDLTLQHCFKTLAGHVTEVWDFSIFLTFKVLCVSVVLKLSSQIICQTFSLSMGSLIAEYCLFFSVIVIKCLAA